MNRSVLLPDIIEMIACSHAYDNKGYNSEKNIQHSYAEETGRCLFQSLDLQIFLFPKITIILMLMMKMLIGEIVEMLFVKEHGAVSIGVYSKRWNEE